METAAINVVTGAFSYTGKYITRRLLSTGKKVRTLTGHLNRQNTFGNQANAFPFDFDNPSQLRKALEGATTLYNTYWIRFPQGWTTFNKAIENTKTLIKAAEFAGVRRIVLAHALNADAETLADLMPYFVEEFGVWNLALVLRPSDEYPCVVAIVLDGSRLHRSGQIKTETF